MSRLLWAALLVVLVVRGATVWGAPQEAEKKADAKGFQPLQGTWERMSIESNGQREGYVKGEVPILTIRDDRYTTEVGGKIVERGILKLGPPAHPRAVDLVVTEGDKKGRTYRGIYEVSGNKWR